MSFNEDTTMSNNDLYDIMTTDVVTTVESFTTGTISSESCNPICDALLGPTAKDRSLTTTFLYSFVAVLLISVIAISIVVFRRYYQRAHRQDKNEKERSKGEKVYAHPFEDILVVVDDSKSIQLSNLTTTTIEH